MKLLVLANHFITLHAFRNEFIQKLLEEGHEVYLSLPEAEENAYFEQLGCKVITAPMDRRCINPIKDLALIWNYYKTLRRIKPHMMISYTIKSNVYGGIACQLTRTPYCPNVTGLGTSIKNPGLLQKITLLLYRMGLRGAQCVFVQNSENQAFLQEHKAKGKRSKLLPGSGVNLEGNPYTPYPPMEEVVEFLTVGRIMKDKGIDELLSCAKEICSRHPNARFTLVGMYDDVSYEEKINKAVAEGYLAYLGQRSDVANLMAQSHCIVHPSYHEGLSNVLLEAAACGRPVIASNVPGCRETFDEGLSGFGVEVKSVPSLLEALEKFLQLSQETRNAMGIHGREKVEREFDRNIVIQAYMDEIRECER